MSSKLKNLDENGSTNMALSDINLAEIDKSGDFHVEGLKASDDLKPSPPMPSLLPSFLPSHKPTSDISDNESFDEFDLDPEFEPLDKELSTPMKHVEKFQTSFYGFIKSHSIQIRWIFIAGIFVLFHVFLVFALIHNFEKAETLLYLTCFAWILAFYYKIFKPKFGRKVERRIVEPVWKMFDRLYQKLVIKI
uniref:Uncharacterized protein n=1 Tax=Panagrolaimus sp. PS1159 TaxID=55785 RepID=A0AC35ETV6_9BILA